MIDTHCGGNIAFPNQIKECVYSGMWQGDETCTNVIAVNGRPVLQEMGEGVFAWDVPETGGDYILTLTTLKDGAAVGPTLLKSFVVPTLTATESVAESGKTIVDTRAGKDSIETDHAEDITYSNLWAGDADATATVAINGEVVKTATDEGVYRWPFPGRGGNYVFTHTTTKGGVQVGDTLTATFVVASRDIEIDDGTDGAGGKDSRFSYSGVYDGAGHGIAVEVTSVENPQIAYSFAKNGPYVDTLLLTNACDATAVWYTVAASGYNTYTNWATVTIMPKELTAEMCVLGDDVFFYDGTEKKPAVVVADTNAVGVVISTEADYALDYGERTGAGLVPVSVTGLNNYRGTVTKEFAILKRPVVPPSIPASSYNGRTRTATVTEDVRWTVVANPGGVDAGDYTNVVLRLTNPDDYRWSVLGEDEAEWTGVFTIRRGANGWSMWPGIDDWEEGATPSEPSLGRPRNGTVSAVLYRRRGADPATGTAERPTRAGLYTARFVVEETANYVGTFHDVDFAVTGGAGGDATATTPVPVPHAWLSPYLGAFGGGDYESAGNAAGKNGVPLWESYVAGLDPTDADSRFEAAISVDAQGNATVTWSPDLSGDADSPRAYTVYGKPSLGAADWEAVTDANKSEMRFFKVEVELK